MYEGEGHEFATFSIGLVGFALNSRHYDSITDTETGEHVVSLMQVIVTHEDDAKKEYVGKLEFETGRVKRQGWWIATPSEEHEVLYILEEHKYNIRPVLTDNVTIDRVLQQRETIEDKPFFDNNDADRAAKERIMQTILRWQGYRKHWRWV